MRQILPLALLMACKPTSAKLVEGSGTMTGYLSANSSFTLIKGTFDPSDVADEDDGAAWNVDCRELEPEDAGMRLEDPLPICNNLNWRETMTQGWMFGDAWRGFQMPLDPWRGEGLMTREGDLQVGFHQRLPGGEDFRWSFAIRPDFQPTTCVGGDGDVTAGAIDGDWVGEWSKDLAWVAEQDDITPFLADVADEFAGGKLYYLNARSYQLNPDKLGPDDLFDPEREWTLPEQWRAGFARATFAEEELHSRPTYYATPNAYLQADNDLGILINESDLYFDPDCATSAGTEGLSPTQCPGYERQVEQAVEDAFKSKQNFNMITMNDVDVDYMPIPHLNSWRRLDDENAGIDGWTELNHSWVVLSSDSEPEVGGEVHGAFSILLDPDDSNSRIVVQGKFDIKRVRKETWSGPNLRAEKFEEAGLTPCIDK